MQFLCAPKLGPAMEAELVEAQGGVDRAFGGGQYKLLSVLGEGAAPPPAASAAGRGRLSLPVGARAQARSAPCTRLWTWIRSTRSR